MALDFIVVGLGIAILSIYLTILFFLLEIRARIIGKAKTAFTLLVIGVIVLILGRIEYIFFVSDWITILYFRDMMSFFFSILLFLSTYIIYKSITGITDAVSPTASRIKVSERLRGYKNKERKIEAWFQDYKKKLRKNVKY
ncbi:hypothetical protein HYT25_04430 [Candidatus Pacearchaeota archaeon]|nr:hypothetical protein [Candidatus Pacearchaeota archaeon]